MRVHEVVIIVVAIFGGSNLAGSMARRDTPRQAPTVKAVAAPAATPAAAAKGGVQRVEHIAASGTGPELPRTYRAVPLHHARPTALRDPSQMALFAR